MLKKAERKAGKVREDICVLLRISLWENSYEERCIYSLKFMASMPEHSHKLPSHLVEELLSEKKELYIWTSLSPQARRAGGAVGCAALMLVSHLDLPDPTGAPAVQNIRASSL